MCKQSRAASWAAHELGHYLAARRHDVGIEYVSIRHDGAYGEFGPHLQPSEDAEGVPLEDILLSGWAAQAYFRTGCRDKAIPTMRFLLALYRVRHGAGWRLISAMPPASDLARLVAIRRQKIGARFPIKELFRLAEEIRSEQARFYMLLEALTKRFRGFATVKLLDAVYQGKEVTDIMLADSETLFIDLFINA